MLSKRWPLKGRIDYQIRVYMQSIGEHSKLLGKDKHRAKAFLAVHGLVVPQSVHIFDLLEKLFHDPNFEHLGWDCANSRGNVQPQDEQKRKEWFEQGKDKLDGSGHLVGGYTDPALFERKKILRQLGFKSYGHYLGSGTWATARERTLIDKGTKCVCCLNSYAVVHHEIYTLENLKGNDTSTLWPVCRSCHSTVHFEEGVYLNMDVSIVRFKALCSKRFQLQTV